MSGRRRRLPDPSAAVTVKLALTLASHRWDQWRMQDHASTPRLRTSIHARMHARARTPVVLVHGRVGCMCLRAATA